MHLVNNSNRKRQVIVSSRENGISYTLFRNTIGKKIGLNTTDFEGLDLIFYRGVSTPSELSQHTGLSSGSTTAMIDRLEKSGLIERKPNPSDRRGTLVLATEQAICTVGPLFASVRVAQNELLAHYSTRDLKILSDYFAKSAAMFEDERQKL